MVGDERQKEFGSTFPGKEKVTNVKEFLQHFLLFLSYNNKPAMEMECNGMTNTYGLVYLLQCTPQDIFYYFLTVSLLRALTSIYSPVLVFISFSFPFLPFLCLSSPFPFDFKSYSFLCASPTYCPFYVLV